MTSATSERLLGAPLDRVFALYMAAAAVALAFPHRPASWPLLLAAHLLVFALGWPLLPRVPVRPTPSSRTLQRVRALLDWTPLLLMPLLYAELATLNQAVHGGFYFDDVIIAWEQTLFGGQPSREWALRAPSIWLSELLHGAYLSYYLIIFVPPLVLFFRREREQFRAAVFALMLTFFVHYLFFIYFPVQGPRYLFTPPGGELADGAMYQLAHRVLEAGSSQGAAFPSSHVGVAVTQSLIASRYLPRLAPFVALLSVGLALGAVYGGFHYVTDVVCGAALGAAVFALAEPLRRRMRRAPAAPL